MPATVKSNKTVTRSRFGLGGGPPFPGPNGNGSRGNGWHGKSDDGGARRFSPEAIRVTVWIVLAAIVMMFVALSSAYAYIALSGGTQWRPVRMPRMFFVSTGIILV